MICLFSICGSRTPNHYLLRFLYVSTSRLSHVHLPQRVMNPSKSIKVNQSINFCLITYYSRLLSPSLNFLVFGAVLMLSRPFDRITIQPTHSTFLTVPLISLAEEPLVEWLHTILPYWTTPATNTYRHLADESVDRYPGGKPILQVGLTTIEHKNEGFLREKARGEGDNTLTLRAKQTPCPNANNSISKAHRRQHRLLVPREQCLTRRYCSLHQVRSKHTGGYCIKHHVI